MKQAKSRTSKLESCRAQTENPFLYSYYSHTDKRGSSRFPQLTPGASITLLSISMKHFPPHQRMLRHRQTLQTHAQWELDKKLAWHANLNGGSNESMLVV